MRSCDRHVCRYIMLQYNGIKKMWINGIKIIFIVIVNLRQKLSHKLGLFEGEECDFDIY